jgi:hypothetical protein
MKTGYTSEAFIHWMKADNRRKIILNSCGRWKKNTDRGVKENIGYAVKIKILSANKYCIAITIHHIKASLFKNTFQHFIKGFGLFSISADYFTTFINQNFCRIVVYIVFY